MKDWKYHLDLSDFFKPYEGRDVTNEEAHFCGVEVAKKIRGHLMYNRHKVFLEPICKKFSRSRTQEGFNKAMNFLYNWADYDKTCWVRTFW